MCTSVLASTHALGCVSCVCDMQNYITIPYFLSFMCVVPSVVESLRGSGYATSVELAWTPPTKTNGIISGYFLTYSTGLGNVSSENVPASYTSYTVTGLENTLYHFTVSAETSAGRGEGSSVSDECAIHIHVYMSI